MLFKRMQCSLYGCKHEIGYIFSLVSSCRLNNTHRIKCANFCFIAKIYGPLIAIAYCFTTRVCFVHFWEVCLHKFSGLLNKLENPHKRVFALWMNFFISEASFCVNHISEASKKWGEIPGIDLITALIFSDNLWGMFWYVMNFLSGWV